MGPQQIAERAAKLGLKRGEFARLASVNVNTVRLVLSDSSDPRHSTLEKLQAALLKAEEQQARRLAGLHPQAALEAATVAMCPDRLQQRSAA